MKHSFFKVDLKDLEKQYKLDIQTAKQAFSFGMLVPCVLVGIVTTQAVQIIDGDQNDSKVDSQKLSLVLLNSVVISSISSYLVGKLKSYFFGCGPFFFFSQNTALHSDYEMMKRIYDELDTEFPEMLGEYMELNNLSNKKQFCGFVLSENKSGLCFGYSIAFLSAIGKVGVDDFDKLISTFDRKLIVE